MTGMTKAFGSPALWLRLAAVVTVVFAALHTLGFASSLSPAADAVAATMKAHPFDLAGSTVTYWGLYAGFGYTVTLFMVTVAVVMWLTANRAAKGEAQPGMIAVFLGFNVLNLGLTLKYFFLPPQVFTGVIIVLLATARLLTLRTPGRNA